jgi:hypothetical protein
MPRTLGRGYFPNPDLTLSTTASEARPTDEHYDSAARLGLLGVMADQDSDSVMEQQAALHSRKNTFPAEVPEAISRAEGVESHQRCRTERRVREKTGDFVMAGSGFWSRLHRRS